MEKKTTKMANTPQYQDLTDEQRSVLRSLRVSRIILPIFIGLAVVAYLLWRQFDPKQLEQIAWTGRTWAWIVLSLVLLILRHLAFSLRMYILSQGHFSFKKCIELIFIFEFSLSVTPTTVGGSAVSLFVMTQEKLSAARTTTIVIYKIVLDSLFFIGTFPMLFSVAGVTIIRPHIASIWDSDWRTNTFYFSYVGMMLYGLFFFYGLFINPTLIKKFLLFFTKPKFMERFRARTEKLGDDIVLASRDMKNLSWKQHFFAFVATWTAWTCKFLLISALIIGIAAPAMDFWREVLLYGRLQSMFIIMAFSPSPGGAGFAEAVFHPFLEDFIPAKSVALVIAFIWRLFSYYAYLAAGAVIVPNWIRNVFLKNIKEKQTNN